MKLAKHRSKRKKQRKTRIRKNNKYRHLTRKYNKRRRARRKQQKTHNKPRNKLRNKLRHSVHRLHRYYSRRNSVAGEVHSGKCFDMIMQQEVDINDALQQDADTIAITAGPQSKCIDISQITPRLIRRNLLHLCLDIQRPDGSVYTDYSTESYFKLHSLGILDAIVEADSFTMYIAAILMDPDFRSDSSKRHIKLQRVYTPMNINDGLLRENTPIKIDDTYVNESYVLDNIVPGDAVVEETMNTTKYDWDAHHKKYPSDNPYYHFPNIKCKYPDGTIKTINGMHIHIPKRSTTTSHGLYILDKMPNWGYGQAYYDFLQNRQLLDADGIPIPERVNQLSEDDDEYFNSFSSVSGFHCNKGSEFTIWEIVLPDESPYNDKQFYYNKWMKLYVDKQYSDKGWTQISIPPAPPEVIQYREQNYNTNIQNLGNNLQNDISSVINDRVDNIGDDIPYIVNRLGLDEDPEESKQEEDQQESKQEEDQPLPIIGSPELPAFGSTSPVQNSRGSPFEYVPGNNYSDSSSESSINMHINMHNEVIPAQTGNTGSMSSYNSMMLVLKKYYYKIFREVLTLVQLIVQNGGGDFLTLDLIFNEIEEITSYCTIATNNFPMHLFPSIETNDDALSAIERLNEIYHWVRIYRYDADITPELLEDLFKEQRANLRARLYLDEGIEEFDHLLDSEIDSIYTYLNIQIGNMVSEQGYNMTESELQGWS